MSEEQIEAISMRRCPNFIDPALIAAHNVAFELVYRRELTDATYRGAVDALGERGLVEVTCAAGSAF